MWQSIRTIVILTFCIAKSFSLVSVVSIFFCYNKEQYITQDDDNIQITYVSQNILIHIKKIPYKNVRLTLTANLLFR